MINMQVTTMDTGQEIMADIINICIINRSITINTQISLK